MSMKKTIRIAAVTMSVFGTGAYALGFKHNCDSWGMSSGACADMALSLWQHRIKDVFRDRTYGEYLIQNFQRGEAKPLSRGVPTMNPNFNAYLG